MGARGKESHDLFLSAPEKRRTEVEQGDNDTAGFDQREGLQFGQAGTLWIQH